MLLGSGGGVTPAYGATAPERYQAAILLLRLMGKESEAAAFTGTENFSDASKVNASNQAILAYLKAHPEYGFSGNPDGTFDPLSPITAQQYYKVVLTALGYTASTDYQYADTISYAKSLGLACAGNVDSFTIDSLATATVEALKADVKGGTKTLAQTIADANATFATAAAADGLISTAVTATAAATGAKKLTVTFNQAVADTTKATFDVTRDGVEVAVTPTWSADKTSVDLAPSVNLIAGNYAITVKGLTSTDLTLNVNGVKDQVVTKINLNGTQLAAANNGIIHDATITYKALNQYGEDVTTSAVTPHIFWTSSIGTASGDDQGTVTIDNGGGASPSATQYFTVGQTVVLTGVITDPSAAGVSVTATLTVGTPASTSNVTFDKVYDVDGSTLATNATFGNFYLLFTAVDQYGNSLDAAQCNADLYVYSTNPSVTDIEQHVSSGLSYPVMDKQGPNANELGMSLKHRA